MACAMMITLVLTGCGGMPVLTIDRSEISAVVVTANAEQNEIGQITEPGFSGASLPSFTATLAKGNNNYAHIRILVETNESIQIIGKDTNNIYYNIAVSGWGPAEGFELTETQTTTFYVVASEVGNYSVVTKVVDVANNNAVLTQKTELINVIAAQ